MAGTLNLKPVHQKILALLDRMDVLSRRRIAEILDIAKDTVEGKLEYLEEKGLVKLYGVKIFGKSSEANLWELTEEGKSFVKASREKGEMPGIKLSEMNEKVFAICMEIVKILESPMSFDELSRNLEASGIKMREYRLSDLLKLLETFGTIKTLQGPKEIKVHGILGTAAVSPEPGGIIVFVKSEGADLNTAEF